MYYDYERRQRVNNEHQKSNLPASTLSFKVEFDARNDFQKKRT
jgi:hypothetical protein